MENADKDDDFMIEMACDLCSPYPAFLHVLAEESGLGRERLDAVLARIDRACEALGICDPEALLDMIRREFAYGAREHGWSRHELSGSPFFDDDVLAVVEALSPERRFYAMEFRVEALHKELQRAQQVQA